MSLFREAFQEQGPFPDPNDPAITAIAQRQVAANQRERAEAYEAARPQNELLTLRIALGPALCRIPPDDLTETYRLRGSFSLAPAIQRCPCVAGAPLDEVLAAIRVEPGRETISERDLLQRIKALAIEQLHEYAAAPAPGNPVKRQSYYVGPWSLAGQFISLVRGDLDRQPKFALDYTSILAADTIGLDPQEYLPGVLTKAARAIARRAPVRKE